MTRRKLDNPKVPMGVSVRKTTKSEPSEMKPGDMLDILHGYCPKCGSELEFDVKLSKYTCNGCESAYSYELDCNKVIIRQWKAMKI